MSKNLLKFLFLLATAVPIFAQKKSNFDLICERTSSVTAYKDLPKAIKTADSLYMKAQKPSEKIRCLVLSSELYHHAGELKKAICYSENAYSVINQINDPEWMAVVTRLLARQYRQVGLYERSKKYIVKGLQASAQIVDFQKSNEAAGLLNQEMAFYEMEMGNFPNAIRNIESSLKYFEKINSSNENRTAAASYQLLGDVYFKLNDYSVSENYYRKAEGLLKNGSCTLGLVYNGLGGIRLKQKNWKDAELYLKKAEKIADTSRSLKLKKAVYSNINDYYEGIGDNFKASLYAVKYIRAYDSIAARNQSFAAKGTEPLKGKPHKKGGQMNLVKNAAIIILFTSLVGLLIFFRTKQRKQRSKFRNIIRAQLNMIGTRTHYSLAQSDDSEFSNIFVEEIDEKDSEANRRRNDSLMTSETESKLLELLEEFEKGDLYNNKGMSLSFLAGELNTNTKYLSYVINQHKNADFKTYINRLRINYIVDKLINDEKYRQYKISILADECGFSSHSKFAAVFKAVTDYSPSAYIKYLDAEKQSDKNVHFPEND
ncbi:tetratricopeptide (TPR) repeat protein [Chryseobacterium bernardetii]|jgi:tetratricopeptide (TPR) repeat protein|uniref:Tetratricopeptide repeat protein n=2 Tax=Chryseobacterium TaxID=59732 RepID=A0A543ELV8_9FLAO|nr:MULTISPECIES: AraC family transcriptional regulator [Chryseobacterium]MDR6368941.1 tetratricopeptide (TPR) repeat protein [Chryseobacterium vietnamense]MDR6440136.1 tetratricopeptide (TPR) repeat protein [Chryseobacterium bernardetii]TQM22552.1 tetratricopeptide repeat protein [Chryseobacterium aquifrigidense]